MNKDIFRQAEAAIKLFLDGETAIPSSTIYLLHKFKGPKTVLVPLGRLITLYLQSFRTCTSRHARTHLSANPQPEVCVSEKQYNFHYLFGHI